MNKRNLFDELMTSLKDAKEHDRGKLTLHTTKVALPHLSITPNQIRSIREKLNMSQSVFAALLHTRKRTYEKWEQGETTPNEQAITLLKLVDDSPSLVKKIANIQ